MRNTDFTFKLSPNLLSQFKQRCGLVAMSVILRLLITAFVVGDITTEQLAKYDK